MSFSVSISSVNYSGETAFIKFYPSSGGTIIIGSQVIPYTYTSNYYYGNYSLFFSKYNETCLYNIPEPTPTPTPTPTPIELFNAIITEESNVYIQPGDDEYLIYLDPPT